MVQRSRWSYLSWQILKNRQVARKAHGQTAGPRLSVVSLVVDASGFSWFRDQAKHTSDDPNEEFR